MERARKSAEWVLEHLDAVPEIGLVLGSCAGSFASLLENPVVFDYRDIPDFLLTTVEDHEGKLLCGTVGGRRVACLSGRFHYYEGHPFPVLTLPMQFFRYLGVKAVILTNAAGAIAPSYRAGDVMILRDQLKLMGESPLQGANDPSLGERFPDCSAVFDPALRKLALDCAVGTGLTVHEGTYIYFAGPQFETPAEIRTARFLGGDAVGMSTVTETITAVHCGLPILGLSLLVNPAAGVVPDVPVDSGIGEVVAKMQEPFSRYLRTILERILP